MPTSEMEKRFGPGFIVCGGILRVLGAPVGLLLCWLCDGGVSGKFLCNQEAETRTGLSVKHQVQCCAVLRLRGLVIGTLESVGEDWYTVNWDALDRLAQAEFSSTEYGTYRGWRSRLNEQRQGVNP